MPPPSIYMCPVCGLALGRDDTRYACGRGHSFDIAREGYVNLLLAQHKKTTEPGDSPAMIRSRRAFLQQGHYDPVADALNRVLLQARNRPCRVLDAGCGEGFYLWKLASALSARGLQDAWSLWGCDISKAGIRAAARRAPLSGLAVASSYRLPVLPASLDIVCCVFAPVAAAEFLRVLGDEGLLLILGPGPSHLDGLRRLVYEAPRAHPPAPAPDGFALVGRETVSYPLRLQDADSVGHLVSMTPYYWNMDAATQARVLDTPQLETTVDVSLSLYRKA